jgi:hypothetical protein
MNVDFARMNYNTTVVTDDIIEAHFYFWVTIHWKNVKYVNIIYILWNKIIGI